MICIEEVCNSFSEINLRFHNSLIDLGAYSDFCAIDD